MRKTEPKEMYIVRYADDFMIFSRIKTGAQKIKIGSLGGRDASSERQAQRLFQRVTYHYEFGSVLPIIVDKIRARQRPSRPCLDTKLF